MVAAVHPAAGAAAAAAADAGSDGADGGSDAGVAADAGSDTDPGAAATRCGSFAECCFSLCLPSYFLLFLSGLFFCIA